MSLFPKVIKTGAEHATATAELTRLMDLEPPEGSADADRLELLAMLLESYEKERFPLSLPDPVDAIRFCMEQQNLGNRDLIPYLGSASRVSEVLARKRPINLAMARRLHEGLGIPAEVLLRGAGSTLPAPVEVERFPFPEMYKRGWFTGFKGSLRDAKRQSEDLLQAFFGRSFDLRMAPGLCRQNVRTGSTEDPYAVLLRTTDRKLHAHVSRPQHAEHRSTTRRGVSPATRHSLCGGTAFASYASRWRGSTHRPGRTGDCSDRTLRPAR
jgi:HTH-type transcriptional regulator/antitoxin HigA